VSSAGPDYLGAADPCHSQSKDNRWGYYLAVQNLSGLSDGLPLDQNNLTSPSLESLKNGIYALKNAEIFTLMVLPPHSPQEPNVTIDLDPTYAALWADALAFCRRNALIDRRQPVSRAVDQTSKAYSV